MVLMVTPRVRRRLIEVALPLDAINAAAAREKSIRHGHLFDAVRFRRDLSQF